MGQGLIDSGPRLSVLRDHALFLSTCAHMNNGFSYSCKPNERENGEKTCVSSDSFNHLRGGGGRKGGSRTNLFNLNWVRARRKNSSFLDSPSSQVTAQPREHKPLSSPTNAHPLLPSASLPSPQARQPVSQTFSSQTAPLDSLGELKSVHIRVISHSN